MGDDLLEKAEGKGGYLVTDDEGGKHLPTTTNGKPDHRLMGAAWAALHGGYRGQKYKGPRRGEAIAKLRALYKREGMPIPSTKEADDMDDAGAVMQADKQAEEFPEIAGGAYIPIGATSFTEVIQYYRAEEARSKMNDAVSIFQQIVGNIIWDPNIKDKGVAIRKAVDELDNMLKGFASETTGKAAATKEWFSERMHGWLGITPKAQAAEPKQANGLMVWKEGDRYRWLAVYSNNYLDEDRPREIISAQAHRDFIKEVDSGKTSYPELWHYHVPGTRWGQADWLAYDESTGFALASGFVDTGHEKEAEALAALPDVAVSHGMRDVVYDESEKHVINRYTTVEVSDLPLEAAANKLTGFQVLKEGDNSMSIPDAKKEYLRSVGLSDEKIDGIEADLADKAQRAQEQGLASKEETAPPEATPPVEEPVTEEPTTEEAQPPVEGFATKQEVAEAIIAGVKPLADAVANLTAIVQKMAKTDEEKVTEKASDTPAASIAALVLKGLSVVGNDNARVDRRTALAKDGPTESKSTVSTGIPWVNEMLAH